MKKNYYFDQNFRQFLTGFIHWRVTLGYLFAFLYLFLARPASLFLLTVGLEIAFLGLLLRLWASGYLRKSEELCVGGPYAYVRHPLYLGSFLLGFGFCLAGTSPVYWLRSGFLWLFFLLGFSLIYSLQMRVEETGLEKSFGDDYRRYLHGVPRFFPRLTKYNGGKISFFNFSLFRMNKEYLAAIGFLLLALFVTARYAFGGELENKEFIWRRVENRSFLVGEKLLFVIKWGIIPAGYATLEIPERIKIGEREAYRIISRAQSNSFFDIFYKVRDHNESWSDMESLCSLGYEKHLKEGSYIKNEKVIFDQIKGVAIIEGENKEIPIAKFTHDLLSGLYFMRTQDLKIGETYFLEISGSGKNWQLEVKVSHREKIEVTAGKFDCWVIEPFLKFEGIFQHKGRILIWMSADEKKIPVLMRTKIPLGSIDAELTEVKNVTN